MKHYLLTWYGITDLRAALGLEATDGPILGALKTGKFTDVVILAYTNPAKDQNAFTSECHTEWEKWRKEPLETRLNFSRDKSQQIVDMVSNTITGHTLFAEWLKKEISSAGKTCNIQIIPHELKRLNDTRGIYKGATSALKMALSDINEKTITTFISPGTPVMAYTWALIARANPQMNINVISSSDPRKPPEKVDLPKDLLIPIVSSSQITDFPSFDIIIHLLGRERMPIYFGMLQFQAKEHIFITTSEYANAANILSQLLPVDSQGKVVIINDPFKPADTRKAIEDLTAKYLESVRIAVNLTGGTKLMFAGALSACWESNLEPFYFEINHHNVIFIRNGNTVPFIGVKSITDFFGVNGFVVITKGKWEDKPYRNSRLDITQKLWDAREILGKLYQTSAFRSYKPRFGENPPFDWPGEYSHASFDGKESTLVLEGEAIPLPDCNDFGQYLGGGWFEEYVFNLLRLLENEGLIYDLRIGLEVDYAEKSQTSRKFPIGEFDCVFTDGKRLWIVECKAGAVKQDHIQKLENNLKTYGGIAAKGLLFSTFKLFPSEAKRVSSSTSIRAVDPDKLQLEYLRTIIIS
jgi:hypothetical protein